MRILMLGWELPPHNSGGLGVACYHMAHALSLQGSTIDFVVPYSADHSSIDFMNVHAATKLTPSERDGLGAYDHGQNLYELDNMFGVQDAYTDFAVDLAEKTHPNVIHAHDWLTMKAGMAVKRATNAPLIVHVHATEFDRSGDQLGNPLIHEIEQQGLLVADHIIAVSEITKRLIVENYHIPADKVEVVHNAIDVDSLGQHIYAFSTYRYIEDLKAEGFTVVGAITRLTIQKGLTHFLHAAARALEKYDRLVFVLAGDGEQRDELLALSAKLGISDRVIFTGFVRGKQWRDAYSLFDIFVMSSVSEPFGLTALEAAHYNNALIISRQSGVGEVLHSIFRYDFWDTDKLADQIAGIALSPALKHDLKQNIKHEYKNLSWDKVAAKCLTLYENVRWPKEVLA